MVFESLSEKLQGIFKNLRGKGRLTEADVDAALREVKLALLEADVNFKVVKTFIANVKEAAVGEGVLECLTPGQMVIKIVNEKLTELMGGSITPLELGSAGERKVLMLCGLQGAGKTTTAAKLAAKKKSAGKKPLLVALDVYRPAAIEQLQVNGKAMGIPVFALGTDKKPAEIASEAIKHAQEENYDLVILDTAGRLHVDEDMMGELAEIKSVIAVDKTVLVVDAMTGQDAVNVATSFNDEVGIDGVILTKLDGDSRGGAALSIRQVTGRPIFYAGMGEKASDLEEFYPDRMASRILGMGDMLSLIEKAQDAYDEANARKMAEKMRGNKFDSNDYLEQSAQLRKMGNLTDLLGMLPGVGNKLKGVELPDDKQMKRVESIIYSMTPYERSNPDSINPSRRNRIAKGAGVDVSEVNRLIKQFGESRKMMKQMSGMLGKKSKGGFKFPF